ncbi:MAG: carcinine hydrolase/isopenicillin-N N-acyltransferase family protein, partial [Smithellaceae bacterium]|nr:carcinine hydrolase/isopenicillin-N N-acyltransferase family protein [Smithellaceae bacterium]
DEAGIYDVKLTANDGWVNSEPAMVKVTVNLPIAGLANAVMGDNGLSDQYDIVARYGKSYLAVFKEGKTRADGTAYKNQKKLLYLEGTAYDRGYAEGYLCSESVYRMTNDFVYNFIVGMVGSSMGIESVDMNYVDLTLLPTIKQVLVLGAMSQQYAIPQEYINEMQGIADGCQDRGLDVRYEDVLAINAGYDFLLSVEYSLGSLLCNEYSAFGNATANGHLYHGRDFMFSTGGDIFSDEALIQIHKQTDEMGKKTAGDYVLASFAVPGFVGTPTAMNQYGLSFGMDMVPNKQNNILVSGMGSLLLCRNVVEHAKNIQEATKIVRNTDRGVSWLFMEAAQGSEGISPNAAVLETCADGILPDGDDLLNTLIGFVPGLSSIVKGIEGVTGNDLIVSVGDILTGTENAITGGIDLLAPVLGDLHPDRGVAVRTPDYVDPEDLAQYQVTFPMVDLMIDSKTEDTDVTSHPNALVSFFPMQYEKFPDVVAMTNHYILPVMNATQMGLFYHTIDTLMGGGRESEWRYRTMTQLITRYYGKIDRRTGMWLIDFLNPARSSFYGLGNITQSVKGHHILIDDTTLDAWVLHGYYDEPWVHINLNNFLK